MKGVHPNLRHTARLAAIVCLVGTAGCQSPRGGTVNPFLAPDRVPPPATRAILPGQAQPYYPGDPLPVMQSATQPAAAASLNTGMAWNAPSANSPSGSVSAATPNGAPAPSALAFANEPTVAIPADNGDLRFPLPMPSEPEPFAPVAAAEPAAQQPVQLASAPAYQQVVPASYTEPVMNGGAPASYALPETIDDATSSGPWRSPQVATASAPVEYGVPPMFSGAAPLVPQANSMEVRLRAVPSPPPEPLQPSTPRIRLPGYAAPQPWTGVGAAVQPMAGAMVQTASLGPLPPQPYDPTISVAASPGSIAAHDGFRPRSSMR